jgi:hypothetical protein
MYNCILSSKAQRGALTFRRNIRFNKARSQIHSNESLVRIAGAVVHLYRLQRVYRMLDGQFRPVRIADFFVGPRHPCLVVAEAGVNHNGDLDLAR